jgi:serine/threonine protein kinase
MKLWETLRSSRWESFWSTFLWDLSIIQQRDDQMMLVICKGMEFLHSNVYPDGSAKQVLFHQDLKSANVLICMEGTPPTLRGKLSDFGLSCKILILKDNPIYIKTGILTKVHHRQRFPSTVGPVAFRRQKYSRRTQSSRDAQMSLQESSF